MLVDSMSGVELLEEYNEDLPEIQMKTQRFDESEYVKNYLWKRRKQDEVTITKIFRTARGNRYVGILIYDKVGMGKSRQWQWTSYHFGLMNTFKGTAAIAFFADKHQSMTFTPHFFKRYKERYLKAGDWRVCNKLLGADTVEELVPIYMRRNLSTAWIETKSVFCDKTHIFAPVNDGVALIQWDKKTQRLQANTFLTMDMLNKNQTEMVLYARQYFSLPPDEQKKYKAPDFLSD